MQMSKPLVRQYSLETFTDTKDWNKMSYLASLSDANISGTIEFPFETVEELGDIFENVGMWQTLPTFPGSPVGNLPVLLSEPSVRVFENMTPEQFAEMTNPYAGYDLYPDFVVTGSEDGTEWERA